MTKNLENFYEPGYYADECGNGYIITFDPGAHMPQEIEVFLTESEYQIIQDTPERFGEIVDPAMRKQNVKVI